MSGHARTRYRRPLLLAVLALVLFLALPFMQAGFAFLGHALSPTAARPSVTHRAWPADGETLASLTPTFRWPAVASGPYAIDLYRITPEGELDHVHAVVEESNRFAMPPGLLEPDETYYWECNALDGSERTLAGGQFDTATRLVEGPLAVSPATYVIAEETFLNGRRVQVDVPEEESVTVVLPPALISGGTRSIRMTGSFSLPVRPSLDLTTMDLAVPPVGETDLGDILVTSSSGTLRVPVVLDGSTLGALRRSVTSGFHPVYDTPAFANFAQGVLARLTRGTCLGMVLAAERNFRDCRKSLDDSSLCPRMRLRSLLDNRSVREEMNFLHLANLDPQNWSVAVRSLAAGGDGRFTMVAEVLQHLAEGQPVPVAIVSPSPAGSDNGSPGHALLAYAVHEFDDVFVVYVYDPDVETMDRDPVRNFLLIRRAGPLAGQILYPNRQRLERVDAFVLPEPTVLAAMADTVAHSFTALDTTLANRLGVPGQ